MSVCGEIDADDKEFYFNICRFNFNSRELINFKVNYLLTIFTLSRVCHYL